MTDRSVLLFQIMCLYIFFSFLFYPIYYYPCQPQPSPVRALFTPYYYCILVLCRGRLFLVFPSAENHDRGQGGGEGGV